MDRSYGSGVRIWSAITKACCGAPKDIADAGRGHGCGIRDFESNEHLWQSADRIWVCVAGAVRHSEDDGVDDHLVLQCGEVSAVAAISVDDFGPGNHAAGIVR